MVPVDCWKSLASVRIRTLPGVWGQSMQFAIVMLTFSKILKERDELQKDSENQKEKLHAAMQLLEVFLDSLSCLYVFKCMRSVLHGFSI